LEVIMKKLAIVAGALLATAAATASAQVYWRTYDNYYADRSNQECWNPRAGHFEQVRPGEYQGDLDFRNCRMAGGGYYYEQPRYVERDYRGYGYPRQECWNPRARHYEEVRAGEYQNDLDYNRCRVMR
jgi:hypothetical protein